MTLYTPNPGNAKLSARKYRRHLRLSKRLTSSVRNNYALSQQWKRYPNSKTIVDLRLGNKTHTALFPKGYDPFFHIKSTLTLPIKGEQPDILANHPDVDKIILSDTDTLKGVCLKLWSYNLATIERFKYHGLVNIPKGLQAFHQTNARTYQMFELWMPQTDVMVHVAHRIAKALNLPLLIDLSKGYLARKPIEIPEFKPFDEDMHFFGEFFGQ